MEPRSTNGREPLSLSPYLILEHRAHCLVARLRQQPGGGGGGDSGGGEGGGGDSGGGVSATVVRE